MPCAIAWSPARLAAIPSSRGLVTNSGSTTAGSIPASRKISQTVQAAALYPGHQQPAVHPAIPPAGILADQPQHQDADRARGARPARVPGPGPPGMPACDHIAVPAEDGIRAHHHVQPVEHVPGEPAQQRRQQRPITPGEPHPVRTELPLQDPEPAAHREDLRVLFRLLTGSRPSSANTFITPIQATRSSTADHHATTFPPSHERPADRHHAQHRPRPCTGSHQHG
jgi:hypothetical protein